jgi:hypothetical protein
MHGLAPLIEKIEVGLNTLLKLKDINLFSSIFVSVDRLLDLIRVCPDFNLISECLEIIFVVLEDQTMKLENYKFLEKDFPRLIVFSSYVLLH